MEFKIGEEVLVTGKFHNNGWWESEHKVGTKVKLKERVISSGEWYWRCEGEHSVKNYVLEVNISKLNNKKNMDILKKFKLALLGEPEKSFVKKGITTIDGDLTADGQVLFNAYLLKKHADEFKTQVVDLIEVDDK